MRAALLILLLVPSTLFAAAPTLRLESGPGDCSDVYGVYVAFVVPHVGSLLIATRAFPGGEAVGDVEDGVLTFELAGFGTTSIQTGQGAEGTAVWAMLDRTLDPDDRSGCFAFGDRGFATIDDLKTYLHWFQRDLLFLLDDPAPALTLAGRTVRIEASVSGYRPVELDVVEGATIGLRLPESQDLLLFLAVVVDAEVPSAQVKISRKRGDYFGPDGLVPIGSATVGPTSVAVGGDPAVSVRVVSVGDPG